MHPQRHFKQITLTDARPRRRTGTLFLARYAREFSLATLARAARPQGIPSATGYRVPKGFLPLKCARARAPHGGYSRGRCEGGAPVRAAALRPRPLALPLPCALAPSALCAAARLLLALRALIIRAVFGFPMSFGCVVVLATFRALGVLF